jgi:hypothetical protein
VAHLAAVQLVLSLPPQRGMALHAAQFPHSPAGPEAAKEATFQAVQLAQHSLQLHVGCGLVRG